jgi:hypothetical protein
MINLLIIIPKNPISAVQTNRLVKTKRSQNAKIQKYLLKRQDLKLLAHLRVNFFNFLLENDLKIAVFGPKKGLNKVFTIK